MSREVSFFADKECSYPIKPGVTRKLPAGRSYSVPEADAKELQLSGQGRIVKPKKAPAKKAADG